MFNTIPTELPDTPLLDAIDQRSLAVTDLALDQLALLSDELRSFLLYSVGKTGGHFGAGLGVVELTIALHHLLDLPRDRLVWDVGHQAYPHKILSGRKDDMATLRRVGGISGFPKRAESEFDSFGVGHASTALSAALGMALASAQNQESRKVVAVVGDSALGGGMAFEALSHAGDQNVSLLMILNDNRMSIGNTKGGLSNHLDSLTQAPTGWRGSEPTDLKSGFHSIFEPLGWSYYGPVDGHDMPLVIESLKNALAKPGLNVLHVRTIKGKGFAPAESDPISFHAIDKIDAQTPRKQSTHRHTHRKYQSVFGQWLCETAEKDERLIAITPAMAEGSGMVEFAHRFPDRFFDVGIAEQHAVTLAAGLACEGMKPVVAIYSTFLQRAYDQLIHDVALQNLDVTFAIDRAGLVGEDGPTHHGAFDLSYLRCIPALVIACPSDENQCHHLLDAAFAHAGPAAVRYPRGYGAGAVVDREVHSFVVGEGQIRRSGERVAFLNFSPLLDEVVAAAEVLNATIADMLWLKPLDRELVVKLANSHELLVSVEENTEVGGAGSAVLELLGSVGLHGKVVRVALSDSFSGQGTQIEVRQAQGLETTKILERVDEALQNNSR
ncbi:MAG: 1-deoxy-D-xylulose-5-phosphate synthase [Pseudomonadota bacterium]